VREMGGGQNPPPSVGFHSQWLAPEV